MEGYAKARRQAMETLRFLGTADAAREMAKRMRGDDSDGLDHICSLGLISTPERAAARSALEEALADHDQKAAKQGHKKAAVSLKGLSTESS